MGVEYSIFDRKYRRVYVLGKHIYLARLDVGEEACLAPMSQSDVRAMVFDAIDAIDSSAPVSWKDSIARTVWAFCESSDWDVALHREEEHGDLPTLLTHSRYPMDVTDPDPRAEAYMRASDAWESGES